MLKKLTDLLYEATVGLVEGYQRKSLELAKIAAASCYAQGLKALRKHSIFLLVLVFSVVMLAASLVIMPFAVVLLLPIGRAARLAAVCVLGAVYIGTSLYFVLHLFSEKKWMQFSGFNGLMEKVTDKK